MLVPGIPYTNSTLKLGNRTLWDGSLMERRKRICLVLDLQLHLTICLKCSGHVRSGWFATKISSSLKYSEISSTMLRRKLNEKIEKFLQLNSFGCGVCVNHILTRSTNQVLPFQQAADFLRTIVYSPVLWFYLKRTGLSSNEYQSRYRVSVSC